MNTRYIKAVYRNSSKFGIGLEIKVPYKKLTFFRIWFISFLHMRVGNFFNTTTGRINFGYMPLGHWLKFKFGSDLIGLNFSKRTTIRPTGVIAFAFLALVTTV
jgi:hypothetical protein